MDSKREKKSRYVREKNSEMQSVGGSKSSNATRKKSKVPRRVNDEPSRPDSNGLSAPYMTFLAKDGQGIW